MFNMQEMPAPKLVTLIPDYLLNFRFIANKRYGSVILNPLSNHLNC